MVLKKIKWNKKLSSISGDVAISTELDGSGDGKVAVSKQNDKCAVAEQDDAFFFFLTYGRRRTILSDYTFSFFETQK